MSNMLIFYVLILSAISTVVISQPPPHHPPQQQPVPHDILHSMSHPLGQETDPPKLYEPLYHFPKTQNTLSQFYWIRTGAVPSIHDVPSWTRHQRLDHVLEFKTGGDGHVETVTYYRFQRILDVNNQLKIHRDGLGKPMLDIIHKDISLNGLTNKFSVLGGYWGQSRHLESTLNSGFMSDEIIHIEYFVSWWGARFLERADKQPYPPYPPIHFLMTQLVYHLTHAEKESWIAKKGKVTQEVEKALDPRFRLKTPAPLYGHSVYSLCDGNWVRAEPSSSQDAASSWPRRKALDDVLTFGAAGGLVARVSYRRIQRELVLNENKLRVHRARPEWTASILFDDIDPNVSLEHLPEGKLPQLKGYWGRAPDIMGPKLSGFRPSEVIHIDFASGIWTVQFVDQQPNPPTHFLKPEREYTLTEDEAKQWVANGGHTALTRKRKAGESSGAATKKLGT